VWASREAAGSEVRHEVLRAGEAPEPVCLIPHPDGADDSEPERRLAQACRHDRHDDVEVIDMFGNYADYAVDLGVDLLAVFLLSYVLYFRRHRRADLLLAYVTLNIGIFVAMSLLGTVRVDIALGFGLFAILSIIRLRSSAVTQQEVAYYFAALVLGLVNGMGLTDRWLVVAVNALLLVTMLVVDSRVLRERARRLDVTLDVIHEDDAALVADLERRLGGRVMHHQVNDIDYVRETMLVDVRYQVAPRPAEPTPEERRIEVTLDVVHTDEAALLADLERRLGGWVTRHEVKDIDYVRDTTVVDVRYRIESRAIGNGFDEQVMAVQP
jgi:hypothetical protein